MTARVKPFHNELTKKAKARSAMTLQEVKPLNPNQKHAFKAWDEGKNLVLRGSAGTGKTFLALYFGMEEVLEEEYEQLVIIRSAVQSRDMGFMGGKRETDKMKDYEKPYLRSFTKLFNRGDAWSNFTNRQLVRFTSTSFLRGDEFENSIIVLDEFQNLSAPELHTVLTRVGDGSRLILCGDEIQSDLKNPGRLPCRQTLEVLETMKSVQTVTFGISDVVRSGFVRDYLIAQDRYLSGEKDNGQPNRLLAVPELQVCTTR